MQISSSFNGIQNLYMHRLSSDEVKKIKQQIVDEAGKYTFKEFSSFTQDSGDLSGDDRIQKNLQDFQKFLYNSGIDGKSVKRISELSFSKPAFLDVKV